MATPMRFTCPNAGCKFSGSLASQHVGRHVRCPQCRTKFLASTTSAGGDGPPAPPPPLPAAPAPRKVGRFVVLSCLGGGAFGLVYRAFDPDLQREVALKVPREGALSSERRRKRFLDDARAAAGLHHPHIVPAFDVGEDGGQAFIASAFIDGPTLSALVDEGTLPCDRAAEVIRKLAEALHYAHEKGVIHRDVKPANVMLDARGEPYLIDFGLARRPATQEPPPEEKASPPPETPQASLETQEGQTLGTPAYMCPEAARGESHKPAPAFDQYSLGVVLYELLTGAPPFQGPPAVVLSHVCHSMPVPLRAARPDVPPDLEAICHKAMSKSPGGRYASCQEFAEDLRRFLAGEEVKARPRGAMEKLQLWAKREPYLAWAAGVAAAAVLLAAALGVLFGLAQWRAADAFRDKAEAERQAAADAQAARGEIAKQRDIALENEKEAASQRDRAVANEQEARRQGAEQLFDRALSMAEQGEAGQALLWLAEGIPLAEQAGAKGKALDHLFRSNLAGWRQEAHGLVGARAVGPRPLALARQTRGLMLGRWDDVAGAWLELAVPREGAGPQAQKFVGLSRPTRCLAWDDAGELLAACEEGGKASLWRKAGGEWREAGRLETKDGKAACVAMSHDGAMALVGTEAGAVLLFRLAGGKPGPATTISAARRDQPVVSVQVSPDGRVLLAASNGPLKGEVRLWSAGGKPLGAPLPTRYKVHALAVSPAGGRFAAATGGRFRGEALLWGLDGGAAYLVGALPHQAEAYAVAFRPDGALLLTGGQDRAARLWDASNGQPVGPPMRHPRDVRLAAFTPDGRTAVTACEVEGGVAVLRYWRVAPGLVPEKAFTFPGEAAFVVGVAASGDGKKAVVGGGRVGLVGVAPMACVFGPGLRRLIDLPLAHHGAAGRAYGVAMDEAGRRYLTGSGVEEKSGLACLWGQEGDLLFKALHPDVVYSVALSRDGQLAASGCGDGHVRVWAVKGPGDARLLFDHPTRRGRVYCLAFSPDGKALLAGCRDGHVVVLEVPGGKELRRWPLPDAALSCAISRREPGRVLVGYAGGAQLWEWGPGSPRPLGPPLRHQAGVLSVGLRADGRAALTAGTDGLVWLWCLRTQRPLGPPLRHLGFATALFRPDGSVLSGTIGGALEGRVCSWKAVSPVVGGKENLLAWARSATNLTIDEGNARQLKFAEWRREAGREGGALAKGPPVEALARGADWDARALERHPPPKPAPAAAAAVTGPDEPKDGPPVLDVPLPPALPPRLALELDRAMAGRAPWIVHGADLVLVVNPRAALGSELLTKGAVADRFKKALGGDQFTEAVKKLGMNPATDLDGVVFSAAGFGEKARWRAALLGRFDAEKIARAMKANEKVKAEKPGAVEVYEVGAGVPVYAAVSATGRYAVFTNSKEATAELARRAPTEAPRLHKELVAALKRRAAMEAVCLALVVSDELRKQAEKFPNPTLTRAVANLKTVTLSVRVASGVDVLAVGTTKASEAAWLAKQLAGAHDLGKLFLRTAENVPRPLIALVDDIKIDHARDTVSVSLKASKATIRELLLACGLL